MDRRTAEDRPVLWPNETRPQDIGALVEADGSGLLDPDAPEGQRTLADATGVGHGGVRR